MSEALDITFLAEKWTKKNRMYVHKAITACDANALSYMGEVLGVEAARVDYQVRRVQSSKKVRNVHAEYDSEDDVIRLNVTARELKRRQVEGCDSQMRRSFRSGVMAGRPLMPVLVHEHVHRARGLSLGSPLKRRDFLAELSVGEGLAYYAEGAAAEYVNASNTVSLLRAPIRHSSTILPESLRRVNAKITEVGIAHMRKKGNEVDSLLTWLLDHSTTFGGHALNIGLIAVDRLMVGERASFSDLIAMPPSELLSVAGIAQHWDERLNDF